MSLAKSSAHISSLHLRYCLLPNSHQNPPQLKFLHPPQHWPSPQQSNQSKHNKALCLHLITPLPLCCPWWTTVNPPSPSSTRKMHLLQHCRSWRPGIPALTPPPLASWWTAASRPKPVTPNPGHISSSPTFPPRQRTNKGGYLRRPGGASLPCANRAWHWTRDASPWTLRLRASTMSRKATPWTTSCHWDSQLQMVLVRGLDGPPALGLVRWR